MVEADSGATGAAETADTSTVAEEASEDTVVTSCCANRVAPDVKAVTNRAATEIFLNVVIMSRSRETPGQLK